MRTRTRLDFEGIVSQGGTEAVPPGYGGFEWRNAFAVYGDDYPGSGYQAAVGSGTSAGYNGGGKPIRFELADGGAFGFRGFRAAAAWNNDLEITVEGYRDGELVAVASFTLDPAIERIRLMRDFDRDFGDVDAIHIESSGGTNAGLGGSGRVLAFDDLVLLIG